MARTRASRSAGPVAAWTSPGSGPQRRPRGSACVRVCLWGCRVARVSRGPSLCVSLSYSSHIWNLTSGRYCDPLYPLKQAFPPARCPTEFLEFQLRAGGPAGCLDSHPSQPGGRGRSPLALPGRWAGPGPTDCSGKVHLGPPVLRVPMEAGGSGHPGLEKP